jgi:hypothetical protein
VGGTGAAPVILANYAIASIRFRPLRWFDLTAKGDYFRNALPPAGALLVDGYDVSAEALFRLGSSIEMAGFYSFRDQVAEEMMGPLGFRRNVVGLRLTALYAPASRTVKEVK